MAVPVDPPKMSVEGGEEQSEKPLSRQPSPVKLETQPEFEPRESTIIEKPDTSLTRETNPFATNR